MGLLWCLNRMPLTAVQYWASDEEREDVIQEARKRKQKGKWGDTSATRLGNQGEEEET